MANMKGHRPLAGGQAAVEFIVCLILFLLVITGIIHVANMGRASLYLHAAIRGRAGEEAMKSEGLGVSQRNISDWEPGPDGIRYTADDRPVHRGVGSLASALTEYSVRTTEDWSSVRDSLLPVSAVCLNDSAPLLSFAHGEDTIRVELSSVIRQLIYDKNDVAIREEVWMPVMGGLY